MRQSFILLSIPVLIVTWSGCSSIRTKFYKEPGGGETRDMVAWQFGTFRQNTFRSEQEDGRDVVEWTDEVEGRDALLRLIDAAVILGELTSVRRPSSVIVASPSIAQHLEPSTDDSPKKTTEKENETPH